MSETIVDKMYKEFDDLVKYLEDHDEISFRNTADENFRKSLLLTAASYFEDCITEAIRAFAIDASNKNQLLVEFVRNKAVSRQYHTFFNWDAKNANTFFGLFGASFKALMEDKVKNDRELDTAIKAFLELGRERNLLVHQNFGAYSSQKTPKEIYELYQKALSFVEALPSLLRAA
jgi:hypothetical protein